MHEPLGSRPTMLVITIPPLPVHRVRACVAPRHQPRGRAQGEAVAPRLRWALEAIVVGHLAGARVAEGLGVAWNTGNDAVPAEGQWVLIGDGKSSPASP